MSHRAHVKKRLRQKRRFQRFKRLIVVVAGAPIKVDVVPRPSTFELVNAPRLITQELLQMLNPE
jgi:hypothetical protein